MTSNRFRAKLAAVPRRVRSVVRRTSPAGYSVEGALDREERAIVDECRPYTLTTPERLVATMDSVVHVVENDIPGALVECGVWRGGNVFAMVRTLQRLKVDDRDLFLYDTFEGMTEPGVVDTSPYDVPALRSWRRAEAAGRRAWDAWFAPEIFSVEQVKALLAATGYPVERFHLVVGTVEETIPATAPEAIAVLRLDTDWYASTAHELDHLYPRLQPGGVLLVDDYGHWEGARKAVDEYFKLHGGRPLLARTDYAGRLAVKLR